MRVTDAKAELLAKLRLLLDQSGDADDGIDISKWLEAWLKEPQPELRGATPAKAIRTAAGRGQVITLLERMRGGLPG